MAFKNFKVETDADGIALVTWDIPGRSMNVLDETSITELEAIVKQTSADAAVKGVVITSGKEAFSAGADLSMLEGMNRTLCRDCSRPRARSPPTRCCSTQSRRFSLVFRGIETSGKPWVAAINGLALGGGVRTDAVVPLPRRRGKSEDPSRPARSQGRAVPRRRRHPARAAHRAAAGCDAIAAQGRGDQSRQGQGAEAGRCRGARRRSDQGREGLDQGRRQGGRALGREGFQAAGRSGLFQGRHDDVPGRQRDLPPRDLRQLSGGARHHAVRL